jgi:hypothetical protein
MKFMTLFLRKNTSCIFSFKIECTILEPRASFIRLYLWALCAIAIQPWNVKGKFCSRWKFQDQCGPHLYWNQFEKFMKLLELKGPITWNWVVPHVKFVKKSDEIFWKLREIGSIFLSIWLEESWISLETFWNSVGILCEMIFTKENLEKSPASIFS